MSIFKVKAEKLKLLTVNENLFRIFGESFVQEWIIDTVRDRIRFTGIDSFGDAIRTDAARRGFSNLGFYSSFTERINKESGKSSAFVSLSDTGRFMNSWKAQTTKKFLRLKASFKKRNGHIADNFKTQYA